MTRSGGRLREVVRLAAGVLAAAQVSGCTPGTRTLDEVVMYRGPQFQLKLVRYYENLPFHYQGEVFRVQCASARTRNSPAHKTQEAGWRSLGNGGAIGSRSAAEVAERERHHYLVIDEQTLVWTGNGVNVSFDACGTFRGWYPTSLPEALIIPAEKPEYCKPRGAVDCRQHDFLGEREPRFEDIQVTLDGSISFTVRSRAIRDGRAVRVRSSDFGRTWQTELL